MFYSSLYKKYTWWWNIYSYSRNATMLTAPNHFSHQTIAWVSHASFTSRRKLQICGVTVKQSDFTVSVCVSVSAHSCLRQLQGFPLSLRGVCRPGFVLRGWQALTLAVCSYITGVNNSCLIWPPSGEQSGCAFLAHHKDPNCRPNQDAWTWLAYWRISPGLCLGHVVPSHKERE